MNILDLSDRSNMFYWQTNRRLSAQEQKEIFLDRNQAIDQKEIEAAVEYGMLQAGKSKKQAKVTQILGPIKTGSVNSVFKVQLSDETWVIMRMHPAGVKNGYFWSESLASKRAKDNGVPTYETYFIDDSREKFDFDYMLLELLPGTTMRKYTGQPDFEGEKQLIIETGFYLAKIHEITMNGFGFFDNQQAKNSNTLVGQYSEFTDHIFAALEEDLDFLQSQEVINHNQKTKIKSIYNQHQDLIRIKQSSLIHNDIADWNQLSDGEHVTGIVDWDECHAGDPVMDFAAYSLFYGEPRMSWLKQGYQQIRDLPDGYEARFQLYKLRYLISKMHLRKKRLLVNKSQILEQNLERAKQAMVEVFSYFGI